MIIFNMIKLYQNITNIQTVVSVAHFQQIYMYDDPVTNTRTTTSVVASRDPSYGIRQFRETWHHLKRPPAQLPMPNTLTGDSGPHDKLRPTILISNFFPLTIRGTTSWSSFSAISPRPRQVAGSQSRRTSVIEQPVLATSDLNVGKHKWGSRWTLTICPENKT